MRWMHAMRARLRLLLRGAAEARMEEELRFHLEMETEKYLGEGLSPEAARRRAVIAFGGVEGHKETMRDGRGTRPLEELMADARYALRHFRRSWVAAATMVLVLALGLGSSTAVYAALQGYLTLPAPGIARDEALVRIRAYGTPPGRTQIVARPMPYSDVVEYARHRELFDGVAAWAGRSVVVDPGEDARGVLAAEAYYVTERYFPLLGVRPEIGPGLPLSFASGNDGATPVAVISHALWRQRFGGSPDVVGRTILVDGVPVTVAGVAPRRFSGVDTRGGDHALWLPLPAQRTLERGRRSVLDEPDTASVYAFARLRPGVMGREAEALVRVIAARRTLIGADDRTSVLTADVVPLLGYNDSPRTNREDAVVLGALGTLALLVLLVTCTNASGLLVAMALRRRREIAVRLSLGAGRWRIVRQLLTESVLLALAAAALGVLTLSALLSIFGDRFPELRAEVDGRVIAFTLGLAVATGIIFGLSPALHATRLSVGEVLKDSAASVSAPRAWLQRALVVAQVALTQPLLVGLTATTLLLGNEFGSRAGREMDGRLASLSFAYWVGNASGDETRATMFRMVDRLAAVPGVSGAILKSNRTLSLDVRVPDEDRVAGIRYRESTPIMGDFITPGYLGLMDIPILRGRDFREEDRPRELGASGPRGETPIIVGESLARELWGGADPVGRGLVGAEGNGAPERFVVVGVVADDDSRTAGGEAHVYVPQAVQGFSGTVLVRTVGPAEPMLPLLRAAASAEAPRLPLETMATLAAMKAAERALIVRISGLAAAGGFLALLLSAVGLYTVISFSVGQRTREIGIRTALGADARQVIGTFFASGVRLSALGLVIGLPFGLLALRLLTAHLGMPQARTPVLAGIIAASVIGVAAIAAWIPARRAAAVDPMIALRSD